MGRNITEEQYKELDSKLKSVIESLEYLVTCNQRESENVTCYHAHSLNEPIQILTDAKKILVQEENMEQGSAREITICKECEFAERRGGPDGPNPSGHCLNEDAPLFDYVHGFRLCKDINKGHCQFFKVFKE